VGWIDVVLTGDRRARRRKRRSCHRGTWGGLFLRWSLRRKRVALRAGRRAPSGV